MSARSLTGAQRSVLVLASSIVVAFLAAANAPSPLYERYETAWHASPLIGTIAFAAYAVAVIVGLLWLKELSALLGRRAVLLGAIAGQILALVLFAVAGSFALIVVGRVLQGLASGAALGTLSAAMVESDAERGTAASAASPGAGSGSGALLSGLVVQFLPDPRQTIYLILAAILAIQALFVLRVIPRGQRRPLSWKAVSPRVAVPADAKTTFMSTAPVVFAVWGLSGFYAALSPALYRALSRSDSVWQSALPLFALLAAATATTIVLRRLNGRVQTIIGAGAMLVGLGITVAAIESGSTWLYLVASAVAGVGFGAGFQGPMRSMAPQVAEDQRPALLSAVFLVAYVGLGVSAVIPGALISSGAALTAVASGLAVALAVLTAPALYTATRQDRARNLMTASTAATHAVAACSSTGCSSWPSSPSRSPTTASSSGPSRPAADRRSRPVPAVSPPTKLLSARGAKTTMNTGLPDPNR